MNAEDPDVVNKLHNISLVFFSNLYGTVLCKLYCIINCFSVQATDKKLSINQINRRCSICFMSRTPSKYYMYLAAMQPPVGIYICSFGDLPQTQRFELKTKNVHCERIFKDLHMIIQDYSKNSRPTNS